MNFQGIDRSGSTRKMSTSKFFILEKEQAVLSSKPKYSATIFDNGYDLAQPGCSGRKIMIKGMAIIPA